MFNRAKCTCMLISKRKNHICPTMTLNDEDMELVQIPSWSTHTQQNTYLTQLVNTYTANLCESQEDIGTAKLQNIQMVVLKLYLAPVRPHLEYASHSLPFLSSSSKSCRHHSVCYKVPFACTTCMQHSFKACYTSLD